MAEITKEMVIAIQDLHKKNQNLSAVTVGQRLSLDISPIIVVQIIEGKYNYLLEAK